LSNSESDIPFKRLPEKFAQVIFVERGLSLHRTIAIVNSLVWLKRTY